MKVDDESEFLYLVDDPCFISIHALPDRLVFTLFNLSCCQTRGLIAIVIFSRYNSETEQIVKDGVVNATRLVRRR